MAKEAACLGLVLFFAATVSLIGYGVEGKLPDIGKYSFKRYMCSARECSTLFYRGLQKNPDDCHGTFLSVKSCMKNVLKVCFGSSLNDDQLEMVLKASFREEQFCTSGPLEVPTPAPGTVLPCTQNFTSVSKDCGQPFYEKFQANKGDAQLCSSYASAKKCLSKAIKSLCQLTYPMNDLMDAALDDYNPFCDDNHRDPGATGPGYCDGVAIIPPPSFSTTAGLTAESAFGAFVVLLGAAAVDLLTW